MNKDKEEWKKPRQKALDIINKDVKEQMGEEEMNNLKVTRLKTLKDLNLIKEFSEFPITAEINIKNRLKAEAIKHIKAMRKEEIGYNDFGYKKDTIDTENWVIHFFNINEEELR